MGLQSFQKSLGSITRALAGKNIIKTKTRPAGTLGGLADTGKQMAPVTGR